MKCSHSNANRDNKSKTNRASHGRITWYNDYVTRNPSVKFFRVVDNFFPCNAVVVTFSTCILKNALTRPHRIIEYFSSREHEIYEHLRIKERNLRTLLTSKRFGSMVYGTSISSQQKVSVSISPVYSRIKGLLISQSFIEKMARDNTSAINGILYNFSVEVRCLMFRAADTRSRDRGFETPTRRCACL